MKKIILQNVVSIFIISLLLSGCVAAELTEALAAEDIAAVEAGESVYLRSASVVRLSATEGAIVDDITSLNSSLRRIRLAAGTDFSSPPKLLYTLNGESKAIAEVISENSIRMIRSGKTIRFPEGQLYTVRNKLVNLRTGPATNYNIFTQIEKDEIILRLEEENNGWSKIEIGKGRLGYIKTELLAPLIITTTSHNQTYTSQSSIYKTQTPTSKKVMCPECQGKGLVTVQGVCKKCKGTGNLPCPECHGDGGVICSSCHGTGIWPMSRSWGSGQPCSSCHGKGKTSICNYCDGTGQSSLTCNVCNGKKIIITDEICMTCKGSGKIVE